MELWSYASKEWNSSPIFINTGILTLSFQTLEFLYCPSKHFNFGPIFYTLRVWSHRSKHWPYLYAHWNSYLILPNVGIFLFFFYKHCSSYLIYPLQTLKFSPYPSNHFNLAHYLYTSFSDVMLQNIGILALFLFVLELWYNGSKEWNSSPIFINIGILTLSVLVLTF